MEQSRTGVRGPAEDLLELLGALNGDQGSGGGISVQVRHLPARTTLFHQYAGCEAIHIVRTGTFKCCRSDVYDGERVLGFARRGDVLGYASMGLGRHTSAAVALETSSVAVVPIPQLFTWLQQSADLQRALYQTLSLQQARTEELSGLHAVAATEVRLARFLLHWSDRVSTRGQYPRQIKLPMTRRDIARALGVAHETVSRAFGSLAAEGCVAVTGRTLDILNRASLFSMAHPPTPGRPVSVDAVKPEGRGVAWPLRAAAA